MIEMMTVLDKDKVRGIKPLLLEGERVEVTSGPNAGRMAVITGMDFLTDQDYLQFYSPGHPKRMFARVEKYRLRTRDSRAEQISATPDQVKALSVIDGWGRGQAPEESSTGEGEQAEEGA